MDRLRSPPSDSAMPDGDRHHYRSKLPFGKCAHVTVAGTQLSPGDRAGALSVR
jgi:hypothetical protein